MPPNTKTTLREYLGYWEYTYGTSNKFYEVRPDSSGVGYKISWGKIGIPSAKNQIAEKVSNIEAFRRIREKERGGYTLKRSYADLLLDIPSLPPVLSSADITAKDLIGTKKENITGSRKSKVPVYTPEKPKKKGFSFVDWAENKVGN